MNKPTQKIQLQKREHDKAFEAFTDVTPRMSRLRIGASYVSNTAAKLKPKSGFSHILHIVLTLLLPLLLYVFVRIDFVQLAVMLVLLSKWRMFAVKARHWPANIRANAIDIIVGVSVVLFMSEAQSQGIQFVWVIAYSFWLLYLKPKSTLLWVASQALIGQTIGLMALYSAYGGTSTTILVVGTASTCYFAARHYFSAYDESLGRTTSYVWAYFGASLAWLLSHWLIYYGVVAQPALILSVVGYTLAGLYYLQHKDKLSVGVQRQFVIVLTAILLFVIVFSDWGDKTV